MVPRVPKYRHNAIGVQEVVVKAVVGDVSSGCTRCIVAVTAPRGQRDLVVLPQMQVAWERLVVDLVVPMVEVLRGPKGHGSGRGVSPGSLRTGPLSSIRMPSTGRG